MPDNSSSTVDLILRYIVDQQSKQTVEQSIKEIEKATTSMSSGKELIPGLKDIGTFKLQEFLEYLKKSNLSLEEVSKSFDKYGESGRSAGGMIEKEVLQTIARLEQMARAAEEVASSLNKIGDAKVSPDIKDQQTSSSSVDLTEEEKALIAEEEALMAVETAASKKSATVVEGLTREEQYTLDETKRLEEMKQAMLESQNQIQDGLKSGSSSGSSTFTQFSKEDEEVIRQTVEMAELLDISIEDAAKNMVQLGNAGGRTKEELTEDVKLMQEITGATEEAQQSNEKLSQSSSNVAKNLEKTATAMRGFAGFTLLRVAREFEGLGKAMYSPIDAFVQAEGMATISSGKFLIAQKDIQNSTERIGQVMVDSVLPTIEKTAELASKTADFVEAHPEVAQAAVGLAAGAYTIGGILQVLGTIFTVLSALKILGVINPGAGNAAVQAAKELAMQSELAAAEATVLSAEEQAIAAEATAVAAEARAVAAESESGAAAVRITAANTRAAAAEAEIAAAEARVISANARTLAAEGGAAKSAVSTGSSSGLAAAGVYALAVAMGAYIGNTVGNLVNKLLGQEEQTWADNLVTVLILLNAPVQVLQLTLVKLNIISSQAGENIAKNNLEMYNWIKALDGSTDSLNKSTDALGRKNLITQDEIKAFISFKEQQKEAEQNYEDQRTKIIDESGQKQVDLEQKYEEERTKIIDDFTENARRKEEDFNIKRAEQYQDFQNSQADAQQKYEESQKAAREKFREEERKAEEAHKNNLIKLENEHNLKIYDLVLGRDALGIVNENRAYKEKVDEENRKYSEEEKTRRIQYKLEQEQARRNFEEQQAIAQRNFEEQQARELARYNLEKQRDAEEEQKKLAELKANYEKEKAKELENTKDKLEELQNSFDKESNLRQENFGRQLVDLGVNLNNEQSLKNAYYAQSNEELAAWIADQKALFEDLYSTGVSPTSVGGTSGANLIPRFSGGYTPYGSYKLGDSPNGGPGETEFVMSGNTVKMAEKLVGGGLTQNALLEKLAKNDNSRGIMEVHIYGQGISLQETIEIAKRESNSIAEQLVEAFKASSE